MRVPPWWAAGALALALLACGSRIDRVSFAKIETDMPEAEAFGILGEPTDTSSFSLGGLSASSDDLVVIGVADEENRGAARGVAANFRVNLADERARGVDHPKIPRGAVFVDGG